MENFIIATQTGGILKPFAWILGKILEVIYDGFAFLGIYNIDRKSTRLNSSH